MAESNRFPEFTVSGPPRELGRQIGEALRDPIRGFCEIAIEHVNRTVAISRESAMRIASESVTFAESYAAHLVEELGGTAEAAGVSFEDLMLLQVRNQLQPDQAGGCTSLSLGASARSGRIVAQNWDNDPALEELTVVLTRRPEGKPALTTVGQAGLISYIGFNEAGVGVCLNTLPAPSRKLGVPHYFQVRSMYEADSLDGAIDAVTRAERAIPANIMLTTPQGPADLEVTIENVHVLQDEAGTCVTHTNHCVHTDLLPINEEFPELIQSHDRKSRIDELMANADPSDSPVEQVKAALSDHQSHPRSICRHVNDDAGTGFWRTVFSIVIEAEEQRMHVTRGTPCDHPFEVYSMGN